MAELSNINKYTIDGVEITAYPTSIAPSHNLVSKSWNDMYGVFKDIPVNSKLKINWVFDMVSEEDLRVLWRDLIYNKIISKKSRFFNINTYFPGLGFIKGLFYLGTPTSFTSKDWQGGDGSVNYFQCELHWIEVDGIKLNSPTTIPKIVLVDGLPVKLENSVDILLSDIEQGGVKDGTY